MRSFAKLRLSAFLNWNPEKRIHEQPRLLLMHDMKPLAAPDRSHGAKDHRHDPQNLRQTREEGDDEDMSGHLEKRDVHVEILSSKNRSEISCEY